MNPITPEPASTSETHGDVTYKVTALDSGLVSYRPAAALTDLSVRPGFAEAVAAEVAAMFAEIEQLRAEVAAARKDAKKAEAGALTTFRLGWLAAWQLASELDMSALDVARAAYDETTRAPFTVAEQQRLMGALFDIADDRQGFKSWKPAPMPFDHEGRCDDLTCLSCYPVADQLGKIA